MRNCWRDNEHYRYVIASLDTGPRDLDSELSELAELTDESEESSPMSTATFGTANEDNAHLTKSESKPYDGGRSPCLGP